jgi:dihydrofolate reductase
MKITVINHVTLDGVMQAPGGADEDPGGGFEYGGWAAGDNDAVMGAEMAKGMARPGALLLGRRTYDHFFTYWPKQKDNPFTEHLNRARKYVASTSLRDPLPWENSTLLSGDASLAVCAMKENGGPDLTVLGSGELVESLMRRALVDEILIMIHPVVLGNGKRLFRDGGPFTALALVDAKTTTKGVVMATYQPRDRR